MKPSHDIEAELISLRTSLKGAQKSHASLADIGIDWLKNEIDRTLPAEAEEQLGKWRDRAGLLLSDHPIASAAIALFLGFAFGRLWRRHHDR